MATLKDVQDALAKLAADTAQEKTVIAGMLQTLNETVTSLQAQLVAGTAATPGDMDNLLSQITGIDTAVQGLTAPAAAADVATQAATVTTP